MKLVRNLMIAAFTLAAVACGTEDPNAPGGDAGNTTGMEVDQVGKASGLVTPAPMTEEEIANAPSLAGAGGESRNDGEYAGCWVTLNWCNYQNTGKAKCTATSGCAHPAGTCQSLITQYCGNIGNSGVYCSRGSSTSSWSCTSF